MFHSIVVLIIVHLFVNVLSSCNTTTAKVSVVVNEYYRDSNCNNSECSAQTNNLVQKVDEIYEILQNVTGNMTRSDVNYTIVDYNKIGREVHTRGKYLGCYKYFVHVFRGESEKNTPEQCIEVCRSGNYVYAGTFFKTICLCGNLLQPELKVGDDNCYSCTGNSSKCGGALRTSVYETGLEMYVIDEESRKLTQSYIKEVYGDYLNWM